MLFAREFEEPDIPCDHLPAAKKILASGQDQDFRTESIRNRLVMSTEAEATVRLDFPPFESLRVIPAACCGVVHSFAL